MTTTPDSVSSADLEKAAEIAAERETSERSLFDRQMDNGHDSIELIVDEGRYRTYREIEAVALQAVYNLACAAQRIIRDNGDEMDTETLKQGVDIQTKLKIAFDLIKSTV